MLFSKFNYKINENKLSLTKIITGDKYHIENNNFNKKSLIKYMLNINLSNSNSIFSVTDKNGNFKAHYTSGLLGYKGSQKNKKYTIINILKNLIYNFKFLKKESVIVKYKGIRRHNKLITKKLKEYLIIKAISYDNVMPHNGCRPRKKKRK